MGKPKYVFRIVKGLDGEVVIHMEMLSQPLPTPEKFQRRARLRRLQQSWWYYREISITEYEAACHRVEADYKEKP